MITQSTFRSPWWLSGPHLQTLWPTLVRRAPRVRLQRERLELDDGDFLDLDWTGGVQGPRVLLLHGLEGSCDSPYAAGMLSAIHARGWRGAILHFRGCSGEPNRLSRRYHAGETDDLETVVERLQQREPESPLAVVGFSLGGNVLLRWLGTEPTAAPLSAAVAVSVPFQLDQAAKRLSRGFSRLYQRVLLRRMSQALREKHAAVDVALEPPYHAKTFHTFDDLYTAPLHGFRDADDYYRAASCRGYLRNIRQPTLIIHAADDPFLLPEAIPAESDLSDQVTLELSAKGGHVGFVTGPLLRPRYWLEQRIPDYIAERLEAAVQATQ